MTARQRDVMLFFGAVCFVAAGFLVSPIVGLMVLGAFLLGAVYLLTPPSSAASEEEVSDGS